MDADMAVIRLRSSLPVTAVIGHLVIALFFLIPLRIRAG
jgi:hypothetical protein